LRKHKTNSWAQSSREMTVRPKIPSENCLAAYNFTMLRPLALCAILSASTALSETISLPPDSARWELQGQAKPAEYQGRKCLLLDGGAAIVNDLQMRDGVIDVDIATTAARGFFGIQFRIVNEGANAEWVYLRQHKSGLPD